jgi:hypothetical protein
MNRIAQSAAVAALRKIFVDPDEDTLTLDEIFRVVGRDPQQLARNRRWLVNRLRTLRDYGFVAPIYSTSSTKSGPRRKLVKVQLTPTGKTAITSKVSNRYTRPITLESIARDIKRFQRQNPTMVLHMTARIRQDNQANSGGRSGALHKGANMRARWSGLVNAGDSESAAPCPSSAARLL